MEQLRIIKRQGGALGFWGLLHGTSGAVVHYALSVCFVIACPAFSDFYVIPWAWRPNHIWSWSEDAQKTKHLTNPLKLEKCTSKRCIWQEYVHTIMCLHPPWPAAEGKYTTMTILTCRQYKSRTTKTSQLNLPLNKDEQWTQTRIVHETSPRKPRRKVRQPSTLLEQT